MNIGISRCIASRNNLICSYIKAPSLARPCLSMRLMSGGSEKTKLTTNGEPRNVDISLKKKVQETTKTVWYSGVVIAGIATTAVILYVILKELISSDSPQAIYSKSLEKCKNHSRVNDLLGQPIEGFGEESTRRRRGRVKHASYIKDGVEHLRLKFYIKGIRNQATVHVDMVNMNGSFDYYYLFVETENYPREVVVIEDNRHHFAA